MLDFRPISPGQARALGRLAKTKNCPPKLIVGFNPVSKDDDIVVVGASRKDPRRWDISKGGKVTRRTR